MRWGSDDDVALEIIHVSLKGDKTTVMRNYEIMKKQGSDCEIMKNLYIYLWRLRNERGQLSFVFRQMASDE